jgi:hypothetical protein
MQEFVWRSHDDDIPRFWAVGAYAEQWSRQPHNLRPGPGVLGCQGRSYRSPASSTSWPPPRLY